MIAPKNNLQLNFYSVIVILTTSPSPDRHLRSNAEWRDLSPRKKTGGFNLVVSVTQTT